MHTLKEISMSDMARKPTLPTHTLKDSPASIYSPVVFLMSPILAARRLACSASNFLDLAANKNKAQTANITLHATNSQKSARSCSTMRPQDSQAGVSPCGGSDTCLVGGRRWPWGFCRSLDGVGGLRLCETIVALETDMQCISRRFPNGWQNGSCSYKRSALRKEGKYWMTYCVLGTRFTLTERPT